MSLRNIGIAFALASGTAIAADVGNLAPGLGKVQLPVKSMRELRFQNMVAQERDFSCGAAALATILQYVYQRPVRESEMIAALLQHSSPDIVRERGFSMLDMKNHVETIGLRGRGYKLDGNGLLAVKIPVIALQNINGYAHFVVIKRVAADTGTVYIADPILGNRQMPLADFVPTWNGIVFAVVGEQVAQNNILSMSAQPLALSRRAAIVTQSLPQQREFGLLGRDSF